MLAIDSLSAMWTKLALDAGWNINDKQIHITLDLQVWWLYDQQSHLAYVQGDLAKATINWTDHMMRNLKSKTMF